MCRINKLFLLVIVCTSAFSCKKDTGIQIQSLSKAGTEFYFGEKVPVWASTSGDQTGIVYTWSATGGTFDGNRTQNLFENLWVAPNEPGDYTITATAKNGGSTTSKSTTLRVSRYYFDEFQSVYTFNGNGWSTSNIDNPQRILVTDVDPEKSRAELTSSNTSTPNVRRSLNLAPLKAPFSIRSRLGWKNFWRSGSAFTISLYFNQPADATIPFIREIRWEVWPTADPATTDNYQVRYETFVPATNISKFSTVGNTLPDPLPLIDPVKGKMNDLAFATGQLRNLSFSIDAGYVFHAYIDGNLWFTSNGIKDWLDNAKATYPGFEDPVPREYRVTFPAKQNSSAQGSTMVMKHLYINNDGEILK
jgi:hypothetical protein